MITDHHSLIGLYILLSAHRNNHPSCSIASSQCSSPEFCISLLLRRKGVRARLRLKGSCYQAWVIGASVVMGDVSIGLIV